MSEPVREEIWFLDPEVTWIQGGHVFSKLSDSRPITDAEMLGFFSDTELLAECGRRGWTKLAGKPPDSWTPGPPS